MILKVVVKYLLLVVVRWSIYSRRLSRKGDNVIIIDKDAAAFQNLLHTIVVFKLRPMELTLML